MSTKLILPETQFPLTGLSQDLLTKVKSQFSQAAVNATSTIPRLSFGGKSFNITVGNVKTELTERTLDVHLVAVDPQFHYQFFEKTYEDSKGSDDKGRMMSRYPEPTDEVTFIPNQEWAQRAYKQRAVVMLANDLNHTLYVVDFGYNSIKKGGNPQLGLLNLSQLLTTLDNFSRSHEGILPFMFTIQLSFSREVQPEIQFSLFDQRIQGNTQVRFATPAKMEAIVNALSNGEVDNLMKVEFDSAEFNKSDTPSQPAVAKPVVSQPVVEKPVVARAPIATPSSSAEIDELADL